MKIIPILFLIASLCSCGRNDYDVYLLIGQSNMAGRGPLSPDDTTTIEDGVHLLNAEGIPEPAKAPFNRYSTIRKDLRIQGENPARSFAASMRAHNGRPVLLVVNARGGSSISSWLKDAPVPADRPQYYSEAVRRTKQALQYGELKAILWHQGESDSDRSRAAAYLDRIQILASDLRADLCNGEAVPFIVGEILQSHRNAAIFNPVINQASELIPNSACVSSEGLVALPDNLHFDKESQIELGIRYAQKLRQLN